MTIWAQRFKHSLLILVASIPMTGDLYGLQPPLEENPLLQGLLDEVLPDSAGEKADTSQPLEPRNASELTNQDQLGPESSRSEQSIPSNVDSKNPLEAIQVEMVAATRFLMKGKLDRDSVQLQAEILMRMDELIESLNNAKMKSDANAKKDQEKANSKQQERERRSSSDSRKSSSGQKGQEDLESALGQQGNPSEEPGGEERPSSMPGAGGNNRSLTNTENTESFDPETLEKGTWGHLPERTRKQMQSNRSDRFLPKYRAQIEEY